MQTPGPVINAAYLELQDLLARYADAVLRRDVDDWGACWTPDAIWVLSGHEVSGRDAIVSMWQGAMAGFPLVVHTAYAPRLVVDGGAARGRCTVQEILQTQDGSARQVFGVYHDEFVIGDGWQFSKRRFDVLLARAIDLSDADITPFPDDVDPDFLT